MSNKSVKNLVTRAIKDPWATVLGRRPTKYRLHEVGLALIERADHALFTRNFDDAFTVGVIFEKWASHSTHFACQAAAVNASIYTVAELFTVAEQKLIQSKPHIDHCLDCAGQYYKRYGTYLFHQGRLSEAADSYTTSMAYFTKSGNHIETGKSLLNRGVAHFFMNDLDTSLVDEEAALDQLGTATTSIHMIMASINIVSILTRKGEHQRARARIEAIQGLLEGEHDVERAQLVLRWVRGLLLAGQKEYRIASQMLDRVETRMEQLGMKSEQRAILADRAQVARDAAVRKRIAKKALDLEEFSMVKRLIKKVWKEPSNENIEAWRDSLGSYVPAFSSDTLKGTTRCELVRTSS